MKKKTQWVKWATINDSQENDLTAGWYWVAYWDGSVELMFWDNEGEFSTIEGDDDEAAALSNLVRTEMIYAIKKVVMKKHPLTGSNS